MALAIKISNQDWRVFTTYNDKAGIRTVLAERYDTRNELGHRIAQDDLYIMLLTFPLSGLLIWIIIGRGLDSLDKVAEEVANRAPTHLEPVDLHEVPEEIKPVIDELNKLFLDLKKDLSEKNVLRLMQHMNYALLLPHLKHKHKLLCIPMI